MKQQVPMLDLKREYDYMKSDIDAALHKCLEHQHWILGPEVKSFESAVSGYLSVKHCVGVSSGTEALVLALRALAIQKTGKEYFDRSQEIITTPFTFTATGDAILRSGATPVFVDIDPRTLNIDPKGVQSYLDSPGGKNVVGLIPVHLYGRACAMDEITSIAQSHRLFVVEDVAQAFGASWQGKKLGSLGSAAAFSFFPSKNLGGFGDGGMVATEDEELAGLTRMLLKHGGRDKYNVEHIGYNARLDTLQAAVLLAKLKYLDELNQKRRRIAEIYNAGLKGLGAVTLPDQVDGHVFHQYTIRVPLGHRDEIQAALLGEGIQTMVYYPFPLHQMKVFSGRSRSWGELNQALTASRCVISLPIEPLQDLSCTQTVIGAVRRVIDKLLIQTLV